MLRSRLKCFHVVDFFCVCLLYLRNGINRWGKKIDFVTMGFSVAGWIFERSSIRFCNYCSHFSLERHSPDDSQYRPALVWCLLPGLSCSVSTERLWISLFPRYLLLCSKCRRSAVMLLKLFWMMHEINMVRNHFNAFVSESYSLRITFLWQGPIFYVELAWCMKYVHGMKEGASFQQSFSRFSPTQWCSCWPSFHLFPL